MPARAKETVAATARTLTLPTGRLIKGTLQDRVYERLCDHILNGEIAPGQLVTVQAIADAFGVSAMPVREALQRLSAAKALTVISGRSIGVPPLTVARLIDLRRVRLEVETLAAQWAVDHIAEGDIGPLEACVLAMGKATATADVKAFLRRNREFHFGLYKAAQSDVLDAIIESLWLQISPFFHLLHGSGNYAHANVQHERMLVALKARDPLAIAAALRNDIESSSKTLISLLS
jgi:DNA-binding GntR family transcriptional regulator